MALAGLALMILFWLFISNVYRVVYARVFLEGCDRLTDRYLFEKPSADVIAPWADSLIVQLRSGILWPVCIALLAVFVIDVVYSTFVPNTGKGITSSAEPVEETARTDDDTGTVLQSHVALSRK